MFMAFHSSRRAILVALFAVLVALGVAYGLSAR
jgi:hypothetical protein